MLIARNSIAILFDGKEKHLFVLPKYQCAKRSTIEMLQNQLWCCLIAFLLVKAKIGLNLENQHSLMYIKYDQISNKKALIISTEA